MRRTAINYQQLLQLLTHKFKRDNVLYFGQSNNSDSENSSSYINGIIKQIIDLHVIVNTQESVINYTISFKFIKLSCSNL